VKEKSDEFQKGDITDILSRHKTLVNENQKLKMIIETQEERLETIKNNIKKYEKEKGSEVLSLNNEIAILKTELEKVND
jgi:predicted RNase H-like nuclease (RuvC/YqgF family)